MTREQHRYRHGAHADGKSERANNGDCDDGGGLPHKCPGLDGDNEVNHVVDDHGADDELPSGRVDYLALRRVCMMMHRLVGPKYNLPARDPMKSVPMASDSRKTSRMGKKILTTAMIGPRLLISFSVVRLMSISTSITSRISLVSLSITNEMGCGTYAVSFWPGSEGHLRPLFLSLLIKHQI